MEGSADHCYQTTVPADIDDQHYDDHWPVTPGTGFGRRF